MARARGTETEFAAAAHLLRSPSMAWAIPDEAIDDEALAIDWDVVMEKAAMLSTGERVLVATALALWTASPQEGSSVANILAVDAESKQRVLEALERRMELPGRPADLNDVHGRLLNLLTLEEVQELGRRATDLEDPDLAVAAANLLIHLTQPEVQR